MIESSKFLFFRKWFSVYIYPIAAGFYISGDIYNTYQLRNGLRNPALEELLKVCDKYVFLSFFKYFFLKNLNYSETKRQA